MPGRDDPPFVVLDLEESEPCEAHGIRGVVEDVRAVLTAQHHPPELVVTSERALERRQARSDAAVLAGDIGANHIHECQDAELVFARDAARHRVPDAETKDEQRDQHHHPEGDEEAGPEAHGARCTVPS